MHYSYRLSFRIHFYIQEVAFVALIMLINKIMLLLLLFFFFFNFTSITNKVMLCIATLPSNYYDICKLQYFRFWSSI